MASQNATSSRIRRMRLTPIQGRGRRAAPRTAAPPPAAPTTARTRAGPDTARRAPGGYAGRRAAPPPCSLPPPRRGARRAGRTGTGPARRRSVRAGADFCAGRRGAPGRAAPAPRRVFFVPDAEAHVGGAAGHAQLRQQPGEVRVVRLAEDDEAGVHRHCPTGTRHVYRLHVAAHLRGRLEHRHLVGRVEQARGHQARDARADHGDSQAVCPSPSSALAPPHSRRSAFFTAASVWSTSRGPCASETKHASNCEGARYTPSSRSAWKNLPNRAVSACFADA